VTARTRAGRGSSKRATEREVGVVAAAVLARSVKAAAHRLGLSHSTVKHHLANARSKVGASRTAQLVWILASAARARWRGHGKGLRPDRGSSLSPCHKDGTMRADPPS
jgi:DNA-binding CsgD family transcriptional regulator